MKTKIYDLKKYAITLLCICFILTCANAQKLGKFGSDITKQAGPKTIRVPYTDVISYYGYAEKGSEDAVVDGKKFYYIYLWIPAIAPEIGVRMMSNVGKLKPKDSDFKSPNWEEGSKDKENYFDTYITFERAITILKPEDVTKEKAASAKWIILARNDDSSEMPKNTGGKGYNSLLRYTSKKGDPAKALTRGLYRIGFTTYKKGEVQGTFLAQIGAPVKLPGVGVSKDIAELYKLINK